MTERREIKQRSPAVWAKVKAAYLAGEPAASVARRFDVGYGNLRYRAHAEGWTRKAAILAADIEAAVEETRLAGRADQPLPGGQDASPDPVVDPKSAVRAAVQTAATLLAAGRAAEAVALLKAAEALGRYAEDAPDARGLTDEEDLAAEGAFKAAWEARNLEIQLEASALATQLLGDRGVHQLDHVAFAARWRAEMLGPEVAAADRQADFDKSSNPRGRNPDGSLKPGRQVSDHNYATMRGRMREIIGLPRLAPDEREVQP